MRRKGGAPKTNRTSDLPLRRGLLYPLSYRGTRLVLSLHRQQFRASATAHYVHFSPATRMIGAGTATVFAIMKA